MTEKTQARFKKRQLNLEVSGVDALPDVIPVWERELIWPGLQRLLNRPKHGAPREEAGDSDAS